MKQRRVGTLTLGITLVFIGIIIPLALIYKESAMKILQFSPLVLILLGGEVLYYAIRYKEEKLVYDGLSVFIVIMITFVTIGTSTIVPIVESEIEANATVSKAQQEAQVELENVAAKHKLNASISVYKIHHSNSFYFGKSNMEYRFNCNVDVTLKEEISKEEVIGNSFKLFNDIKAKNIDIDNIRITYITPKQQYTIMLTNAQLKNLSTSILENKLEIENGIEQSSSEETQENESNEVIDEESQPEA